jgi:hypothetical protein
MSTEIQLQGAHNIQYCDMTPKSQNNEIRRCPLLGNCLVNTFPRQRIHKQQLNNFCCYATVL